MRVWAVGAVSMWLGVACTGGGGGGDEMGIGPAPVAPRTGGVTPQCCAVTVGGVTTFEAELGTEDCALAGGAWVASPDCQVVCCESSGGMHLFMTAAMCRAGAGKAVDMATNCGE